MADNNPTSWPPEPENGTIEIAKKPANKAAGWVSLGLTLFLLLVELFTTFALSAAGDGPKILGFFVDASPGVLGLWIGAIMTGITGRRSVPGKVGLWLSLIDLILFAYLLLQYVRLTF